MEGCSCPLVCAFDGRKYIDDIITRKDKGFEVAVGVCGGVDAIVSHEWFAFELSFELDLSDQMDMGLWKGLVS